MKLIRCRVMAMPGKPQTESWRYVGGRGDLIVYSQIAKAHRYADDEAQRALLTYRSFAPNWEFETVEVPPELASQPEEQRT